MWIIEHDGDMLERKKLWLPPGTKYVFGRVATEPGDFAIKDKSISRKHLEITVADVNPGDYRNHKVRSPVTLKDLKTKVGTTINGEKIKNEQEETTSVLTRDQNEVYLGKHPTPLRFTWVPVALTFSLTSKEQKANPFESLYKTFGSLDIKILSEYVRDVTTHVVVKKRNTSKGLQALVNGKYIVDSDPFLKALTIATTPGQDGSSPLQKDFEANFPDGLQYLPPRGQEPTDESATSYAPFAERANMFEGYSFVFYNKNQFETLLAPITNGGGKALLRDVIPNETSVEEFVGYVKSVAGEKGVGEFDDGSEGKGVVVVRYNPTKGEGHEWFQDFGRRVALNLDHRLVEQNEFLDAILKADASLLRRPLEVELSGVVGSTPAAANTNTTAPTVVPVSKPAQETSPKEDQAHVTSKEPAAEETQVRRSRPRRGATRFTGFDSDDDNTTNVVVNAMMTTAAVVTRPELSSPDSMDVEQRPEESQGLFVSQDPDREIQDREMYREPSQSVEPEIPPARRNTRGRKRAASPIQEESADESTIKRRKIMDEVARREKEHPAPPPKKEVVVEKKKKEKKEIDILALAAQQRERTEAAAKAERESLREAEADIDIDEIRNLTIIEEFEVKRNRPPPRGGAEAHAAQNDRWDDKWNGRKNFKKFRRRGADGPLRPPTRVIVGLEEVKKKGFGIGDEYWDGDRESQRRRKKGKGRDSQIDDLDTPVQSISGSRNNRAVESRGGNSGVIDDEDDDDEDLPENPMDARRRAMPVVQPDEDEEDEDEDEDVDPELASFRTRPSQSLRGSRNSHSKSNMTQKSSAQTETQKSSAAGTKRPAANTLTKAAPVKKARRAAVVEDSDDSDEGRFKW